MHVRPVVAAIWLLAIGLPAAPRVSSAQRSLAPATASGQTGNPVYEGWYRNPDGTYSLSFGYYNRNEAEILSVPVGPDNFFAPGDSNRGQPTWLYPRRHWGVFAVTVPADFGEGRVVWTVKIRGKTFAIPATLHRDWQIDALEGEAGSDNTPPEIRLDAQGPVARGPGGFTTETRTATVGKPISISVIIKDDGRSTGIIKGGVPSSVAWFTHQGPSQAVFGTPTAKLTPTGGTTSTTATFDRPGDYIVRVRANDSAVSTAGHSQCCWSNAFVKVRVTP